MRLRNTAFRNARTPAVFTKRVPVWDRSFGTRQNSHTATFTQASVHTPYCSTQTSVDATESLCRAGLTKLTTPHAVTPPRDPDHSYAERVCDIRPRLHSAVYPPPRTWHTFHIFLVSVYFLCFPVASETKLCPMWTPRCGRYRTNISSPWHPRMP